MRRALALAAALAVLTAPPAAHAGARPTAAPIATYFDGDHGTTLGRLDPLTLQPRGPQLEIPEFHDAWSFSPDRTRLAIGKSAGGPAAGIAGWIVDPASFGVTQGIRAPIAVEGLAWLAPRRLVMLLQGNGVQVADPTTGAVVTRTQAGNDCNRMPHSRRAPGSLVVLARGRVVTIDRDGARRIARLRGRPDVCDGAALAISGRRAFVVSAGSRLTQIDLRSMQVTDRRLRGATPGRAESTRVLPLARGRLAAVHVTRRGRSAGVEVIDTRRGTRRTLDRRATAISAGRGLVIAHNPTAPIGLTVYRPGGRVAFRALRGRRIDTVPVHGRFAYAIGRRFVAVIDLRSGRVVSRSGAPPGQEIEFLAPGA